ncbi:hypothetical protein PTTG_03949 [Puccinia triticina 1-1 BBBD Race 1]|uniref:Uncharacterized protein n=1 Tax=Puccinia triticina (isolate 1-1 / race 1 (BBBD)) TaxID=630390 RepID=A0A0C4ET20_PUCT1|nr:hypothetical protein PTTG_03949 [Puccinia triticina 1-1 BBBD Race 1]
MTEGGVVAGGVAKNKAQRGGEDKPADLVGRGNLLGLNPLAIPPQEEHQSAFSGHGEDGEQDRGQVVCRQGPWSELVIHRQRRQGTPSSTTPWPEDNAALTNWGEVQGTKVEIRKESLGGQGD